MYLSVYGERGLSWLLEHPCVAHSFDLSNVRLRAHTQGVTSLQLHTGNTRLLVGCEGPTTYDLNLTRIFERTGDERASLPGEWTYILLTEY